MFGQGDTNEERQAILKTTDSLLDYVRESTASLNRKLDAGDRARVSDYLDSVREIELRVQKLEGERQQSLGDLPDAPLGPPEDFGELLDVQFEMIALAWQTNRTRVATLKMVEEASMRTYPNLGTSTKPSTRRRTGADSRNASPTCGASRTTTRERFAKFAQRLKEHAAKATASVLDHSIILFGSNMANSDAHNNDPLPQALIGRGGGVKGNQHLHYRRTRRTRTSWSRCWTARACRLGHREVRRQHRRVLRRYEHGLASSASHARLDVERCAVCMPSLRFRAIAAASAAALTLGLLGAAGDAVAAIKPAQPRTPTSNRRDVRWQHAAAVGGLQGRRRRGQAPAARRRRRDRSPTTTAPRR